MLSTRESDKQENNLSFHDGLKKLPTELNIKPLGLVVSADLRTVNTVLINFLRHGSLK